MIPERKYRSRMLKPIAGVMAYAIVLLSLAILTTAFAAEQPKPPPQAGEAKQAPAAPVAIPASEIIPRSEQTLRSLQETRYRIAAESEATLTSIQGDITAFAEKSDRRWQGEAVTISKLHSLQRLNDVLRAWSLEQSQLDGWDRALSRRSQILVGQEAEVSRISRSLEASPRPQGSSKASRGWRCKKSLKFYAKPMRFAG